MEQLLRHQTKQVRDLADLHQPPGEEHGPQHQPGQDAQREPVAEPLRGKVSVESTVGKGSTFLVSLPRAAPRAAESPGIIKSSPG